MPLLATNAWSFWFTLWRPSGKLFCELAGFLRALGVVLLRGHRPGVRRLGNALSASVQLRQLVQIGSMLVVGNRFRGPATAVPRCRIAFICPPMSTSTARWRSSASSACDCWSAGLPVRENGLRLPASFFFVAARHCSIPTFGGLSGHDNFLEPEVEVIKTIFVGFIPVRLLHRLLVAADRPEIGGVILNDCRRGLFGRGRNRLFAVHAFTSLVGLVRWWRFLCWYGAHGLSSVPRSSPCGVDFSALRSGKRDRLSARSDKRDPDLCSELLDRGCSLLLLKLGSVQRMVPLELLVFLGQLGNLLFVHLDHFLHFGRQLAAGLLFQLRNVVGARPVEVLGHLER